MILEVGGNHRKRKILEKKENIEKENVEIKKVLRGTNRKKSLKEMSKLKYHQQKQKFSNEI
jgi:hypothetical protein